jgi:hypothetical protein
MSLVDSISVPSTKSELDLFTVPPTQVVIKKGYWAELHPLNPVTNEGPYEFRIPPDPHMLQMSKNYLYMKLKVTKTNGHALDAAHDPIAPINLIGKTFFKQVKLYIGGRLCFDSGDKYAYRSFLETELNYGYDAKNSHLQSALYTQESGDGFDTAANPAFAIRANMFKNSKTVEVTAPLHIDLFMQDRYMLSQTELRLELHRNSNAFVLQTHGALTDVQLSVVQMKLYIRKVEVLDSINLAYEKTMAKYSAKYPIRRVSMINLHITNPARATPLNTLLSGQLPRRIIFGCVDGDAFRGNLAKSPFNFKNFDISEVKVTWGGQTFPAYPLRLDFSSDTYIRAYDMLFEALDIAKDNKGNQITREMYKNGHCLFAFDFTPDEDDGAHWDLIKEGSTSIELYFGAALPQSGVEAVVYAEFDNMVMIDRNRNTFYDYTA